jgi:hypothetical protein
MGLLLRCQSVNGVRLIKRASQKSNLMQNGCYVLLDGFSGKSCKTGLGREPEMTLVSAALLDTGNGRPVGRLGHLRLLQVHLPILEMINFV